MKVGKVITRFARRCRVKRTGQGGLNRRSGAAGNANPGMGRHRPVERAGTSFRKEVCLVVAP